MDQGDITAEERDKLIEELKKDCEELKKDNEESKRQRRSLKRLFGERDRSPSVTSSSDSDDDA